jgi:hypothetical protein
MSTANPNVNRLQGLAVAAGAAWTDQLRDDLAEQLERGRGRNETTSRILRRVQRVLDRHGVKLGQLLADARLASFLIGAAGLAGAAPPVRLDDEPVDWTWDGMEPWLPLVDPALDELAAREMLPDMARQRRQARADASKLVKDRIAKTVEKIQAEPAELVQAIAESPVGQGLIGNAFRDAIQTHYHKGIEQALASPLVAEMFPFEETVGIPDSRQTDLCRIVNSSGIQKTGIYLRDDPVYRPFRPPRHWNCRCTRLMLTVEMAAARGIRWAQRWLRTGKRPGNPPYVRSIPASLPDGWTPPY